MEVTKESLRQNTPRWTQKSLLNLPRRPLTEVASDVLRELLVERGVTTAERGKILIERFVK